LLPADRATTGIGSYFISERPIRMADSLVPNVSTDNQRRLLFTLQRLLEIPAADLKTALTHAANAIAEALRADKVDAFMYDETRDSLVAVGTSTQPLSNLQKRLGLDVLPLSNGGRVVHVYKTGELFRTGNLLEDPEELRGVKEGLRIQSKIGVPLHAGGTRRGMMMIASLQREFFTEQDARFVESAAHWIGLIVHRAELLESIERNAVEHGRRSSAEELITVLAHDLRNYVAPAVLRLYSLRHRAENEGRRDDVTDANVALMGLSRANSLMSDLLDVARLDGGLFRLDVEPVDVVALVKEAAAVLSTAENEIIVEASAAVVVPADSARIRQCIDNVLANAISHSPKGGTVSVFIAQQKKDGKACGCIEVVDEGPGIPDDVLPHIFDRFQTGRERSGGVGLGLYIAKRIASAHSGDIVADRCPGKGARFCIRLPLYEQSLDDPAATRDRP
jgi:signal transduction histidine kinase